MDNDDEITFDNADPLGPLMEQKQEDGQLIKNEERPNLYDEEKDWTKTQRKTKKKKKKNSRL